MFSTTSPRNKFRKKLKKNEKHNCDKKLIKQLKEKNIFYLKADKVFKWACLQEG